MLKWVIAYDIPDDKRRKKLSDLLENYGDRVQYSVFEVLAEEADLPMIMKKIDELLVPDQDSVRLYPLCQACVSKVVLRGIANTEPWSDPDVYIV